MEEEVDSKVELEHEADNKSKIDALYQENHRWRVLLLSPSLSSGEGRLSTTLM